jgi:histidinol-phosphatase
LPLDLTGELALALQLADAADAITLPRFRAVDLDVRHKADKSEVTDADTASEAAMRALLSTERPDHAVLGEEEGLIGDPSSASRWILDPIDGTASFVRGLPIWGTLIALEHDGEIVVGVASAPALGKRWWAAKGLGAFGSDGPLHVSAVDRLEDAHFGHASIHSWRKHRPGPQFDTLAHRVWRTRGVGDFWMHVLVAEGVFDLAAEPVVSLWDLAAVKIIVEEAGGRFTDLSGVARADGGSALSTNGVLHDAALAALA